MFAIAATQAQVLYNNGATVIKGSFISIYPTPFHASFLVNIAVAQIASNTDNACKTVAKLQLKPGSNTIQSQSWATSTYYLTTGNSENDKLLKN